METTATEAQDAPPPTPVAEVPPRPPTIQSEWVKRFLHILIEPRAYLTALYLLIAFPLGATYFAFLVAGAVTGAVLSAVLVGILILVAVMVAAWGFALLERDLAIWLLGAE